MDHAHKIYSTILSSSTEVVDFPLKRDFGYVMLVVIGYNVQLLMAGFTAGSLRGKMGVKYPDMGFGKYSMVKTIIL